MAFLVRFDLLRGARFSPTPGEICIDWKSEKKGTISQCHGSRQRNIELMSRCYERGIVKNMHSAKGLERAKSDTDGQMCGHIAVDIPWKN